MVEQVAVNDKVLGSSPSRGATRKAEFLLGFFVVFQKGHGLCPSLEHINAKSSV